MHTVLVRLQRASAVVELRRCRIGGSSVFTVCARTHLLLDLLACRGKLAEYDDSLIEMIDGHRLYDGQARINPAHDPWWFTPTKG
jgi:hypothetical protein